MKEYFSVKASRYVQGKDFVICRPASLSHPKDHAVMFIVENFIDQSGIFDTVSECLVFWPQSVPVPVWLQERHAIVTCKYPHTEYCRFFQDNGITNLPSADEFELVNGSYIAKGAVIGGETRIMPCCVISRDTVIGKNVYIGAGVKIMGEAEIGDNVVIRENTVIGADSLTTDRDVDGAAVTMPQFGRVVIEEGVQIGANTVIARGAIDETRVHRGAKISGACYISHNVSVGEDTFIAAGTTMLGSSSVGRATLISGNCIVNVHTSIGSNSLIGMGSVVSKSIPDHVVAYGTPAKAVRER